MLKLRQATSGKDRWNGLEAYIRLVEENRQTNPNAALDGAKGILESTAKTILEDKGKAYPADSKLAHLLKQALETLPVFIKMQANDGSSAKSVVGSLENIVRVIGEFRNSYGFFSHGQDLEAEKFDRYLVEMAIGASDLLASFLVTCHSEDLRDRNRVYYEENDEFNRYVDEEGGDNPIVMGIQLSPSRALFSDDEAYKEELLQFVNKKIELIESLEQSSAFVKTRAICGNLIPLQEYLTELEIKRIVRAGIENPQINRILGHGYTHDLYTWIIKERLEMLTDKEILDMSAAFGKRMY